MTNTHDRINGRGSDSRLSKRATRALFVAGARTASFRADAAELESLAPAPQPEQDVDDHKAAGKTEEEE
jgi:hypothetical protein